MSCDPFRELLSQRLDGELPEDARPALEEHVSQCAACRGWEGEVRRSDAAAREAGAMALPAGFADGVRRVSARRRMPARVLRYAAAVAAGVLAGVFGTMALTPEPRTGPDPWTAADELGKHMHASKLLFRQAANLPGAAGDLELVRGEIRATSLVERTARLRAVPGQPPEVRDYLQAVEAALAAIEAGPAVERVRELAAGVQLDERIARVQQVTGAQPRPIPVVVEPSTPLGDPGAAIFAQGRANLFAGNYERAAALFESVKSGPYEEDAQYWYAAAQARQGRAADALRGLLVGTAERWRDLETAGLVKEVAARAGVVLAGRRPDSLKAEDVLAILQQPVTVMVLNSPRGQVMIVSPGQSPEAQLISDMPGVQIQRNGASAWMVVDVQQVQMDPRVLDRIIRLRDQFQNVGH